MSIEDNITPAMSEAVDWVVRFTSGEATHDDLRAFETWREASADNDAAYRALARARPVARAMGKQRVSRRAVLGGGTAVAVAAVTFGLARPPLGLWPSFDELMADHRTGPGQRFAFSPSAGVKVELNSKTSVNTLADGNGIRLIDGETFVSVARENGFRIEARDVRVEATRAVLNIDTLAGGVRLVCLEGHVDCISKGERSTIGANEQWRVDADGATHVQSVNAVNSASWRMGVLQFTRTPLREVVEQFNRYRSIPIVMGSSAAGAQPVSGIFYTDNTDAAVTQLQQLLRFQVRRLPGSVTVIS